MQKINNFTEAHRVLAAFYPNAQTKYNLDVMRKLMDFLGNPQEKLRVIHVAGTSGKTSTAYYLSALLEQSGAKVGLTVSPHVDEVNERVQINHVPLAEAEFCGQLGEFLQVIESSKVRPSYFELLVAFAYWYFAKQKVDYTVVEVGLGGRLDGTNVVSREDKVCVITDIGLDHTEILGDTLEQIATQKAGIIQSNNHVFIYRQSREVMDVVEKAAAEKGAKLHIIDPTQAIAEPELPLFQQRNLGLAKQAADYVLERDGVVPLSDDQLKAVSGLRIPARMEKFTVGGKTMIVDGSHNAQKLGALAESIQALYPGQRVAALVAFVEGRGDSRWQGGLEQVMQLSERIIITSFRAEQDVPKQSVSSAKLQNFCKSHQYENSIVVQEPATAFSELLESSEPLLLVAGSFYLLNSIRPLILKA